jgi:hypothetical protein
MLPFDHVRSHTLSYPRGRPFPTDDEIMLFDDSVIAICGPAQRE